MPELNADSLPRSWLTVTAAAAALAVSCGGPPARSVNPTRALDERRAVEIIVRAFHAEHDRPVHGRNVTLEDGKTFEVDVGSEGHKYAVAYVTPNERQLLGQSIPGPQTHGDSLTLVHGTGDETTARILLLHDVSYLYDDQVGSEHEQTTISAENKLSRDVTDFLVRAHSEKWP